MKTTTYERLGAHREQRSFKPKESSRRSTFFTVLRDLAMKARKGEFTTRNRFFHG